MASRGCLNPMGKTVKHGGDVILYQRISGGWEYRHTSLGKTYRAFDTDPVLAKARLLRQLGWDSWRLDRVQVRRF